MASEAPPSPPSPPSPEPELAQLRRKVEKLEGELRSCKRQVREIEKLLHHTERLYQSAESSNQELRSQVEELSKILHCGRNEDSKKSDVEVQTENHPPWSISDYYYQTYYKDVSLPNKVTELSVQQDQDIKASTLNSEDQSQIDNDAYTGTDITEHAKCAEEDHFASNSQESASVLAAEDTSLEGSSLAESLRAAAEAAVSQTGFSYDENTGLYFDHSTGFYYDSENQLYYDPSTGIYYYCDVESGRYQFHSRVDLQPYQTCGTKQSKDKKLKKKRKDPDSSLANEEKDLNSEDQKASSVEHISCNEGEDFANMKKKAKIDVHYKNSPPKFTVSVSGKTTESSLNESIYNSTSFKDEKIMETDSEPEEGEITDSQTEDSFDEDITSEDNVTAEDSEDEADEEKIWPPCIRVIVIRSPVLQTGSLFIITAVNPATIGREKDMEHTLRIPEVGVSKFHAEIYFDHELQSYVLVDQGSQNGTIVNGKQILQPKTKCDPYVLEHGDEVKIGETVLSFHIHPGSDTCDGCEPGQVRAHLRLDKKDECFVGPALSKEEKELERRKELKKIRVKYGLQNTDYEDEKALKNPKYKDRAGKRREQIGSEGTFQRDDAPASVHFEITDSNKGRKMLEKMGWKKGEGLGKDGGGMKIPIQLQLRRTHAGLGTGKPSSIEDVHLLQNKSKKNWEKARERFAENFTEAKSQKDVPGTVPWVKGTIE
ncbi:angiogenic factor with G patch and FHA domains 1 isoform X1 [Canis lupus baileyi]|uniref:Angiogenic factor with G patch and FHA domains 1 n=1 Tax=Canis lupus familiaris TaxID=9615 RepID=A0A8P0NBE7_CANLF|nr:angiogenic factor with G patch and FHA domains 1 isoform X1 [Canis lupus familiaris]XP_005618242.1 angiogenic factor with G patch and FHA domains 1 isoform X1 [Canis lupus familiaris]XP_025293604.1 angiogenic factor with G patch and FHA domains 1 isoform X1 [Canis lupus dingo]XP_025293605.1 angiogenic factor with G patch and FHA domains 1 isoform X1 [Canis lupus dingo]|eukprot:XP_005618241.1 angiogenic factor with G patch and FHA domains 1 isoform X1 [Canis lupus familiaris]